jgi:hypothetical protein
VIVDDVAVGGSYAFTVHTVTGPSADNANQLTSEPSAAALLETVPRHGPRRLLGRR